MNTLADIVEFMKENKKNPLVIDAWDTGKNAEMYMLLKTLPHMTEVGNYKVRINQITGGGCGMGEHPAEIEVSILLNFK
jgi:hypothetical protein